MEKTTYVIVRGKVSPGLDPGLTPEAMEQAGKICKFLKSLFGEDISNVIIIGTGISHLQMSMIVCLEPKLYSPECGTGNVLRVKENIYSLTNGAKIPAEKFLIPDSLKFLNALSDEVILITDPEFMTNLGFTDIEEGIVIKVSNDFDENFAPHFNNLRFEIIFNPNEIEVDSQLS